MGFVNDGALLAYSLILAINRPIEMLVTSLNAVSYTHLDVYKRQTVRSIPRTPENTGRCLVFHAARQAGAGTGGCYV